MGQIFSGKTKASKIKLVVELVEHLKFGELEDPLNAHLSVRISLCTFFEMIYAISFAEALKYCFYHHETGDKIVHLYLLVGFFGCN